MGASPHPAPGDGDDAEDGDDDGDVDEPTIQMTQHHQSMHMS